MNDPFRRAIVAERWHTLRNAKGAILLAVTLVGLLVAYTVLRTWEYGEPPVGAGGEIVRFGSRADYDGDHPVVVVRLSDGSTRELSASAATLRGCRVGDRLPLIQTKLTYRASPKGCVYQIR